MQAKEKLRGRSLGIVVPKEVWIIGGVIAAIIAAAVVLSCIALDECLALKSTVEIELPGSLDTG